MDIIKKKFYQVDLSFPNNDTRRDNCLKNTKVYLIRNV